MKLSINWLNSYFDIVPNWDDVLHKLTMAGLEVEDIQELADDKIIELKITPNRGDALSIRGLLREIRVLTDYKPVEPAQITDFGFGIANDVNSDVIAKDACPNYLILSIKNINNKVVLPSWMLERLTSGGYRSVSPIVDITNYVMLELGQPLHAFDLRKVGNSLTVRYAKVGESLELLADVTANLTSDTLVICDSDDKPAAIAGVMGGKYSGVEDTTTDIILESAFFVPDVIAAKAKYYGVSSDSAYRFERGVDYQLQEHAIKYAALLITKYCGGEVGNISKEGCGEFKPMQISIDYKEISRLIGVEITKEYIDNILQKLGFTVGGFSPDRLDIIVPSYRFDIAIKEDIVEEIARVYGYDNIKADIPTVRYTMNPVNSRIEPALKTKLVNLGYNEIIAYAFVQESLESMFGNHKYEAVRLQNPIANLNVMRTSLIGDLVQALEYNLNRGHKALRMFELGRVFYGENESEQPLKIAGLAYGAYANPNWLSDGRVVDFYDLRNDIEFLLDGLGEIKFVVCCDNPVFHSGRCAKILLSGIEVGILGQLHPLYKAKFGFSDLPYVFELDILSIINSKTPVVVREISRFQKVERDLAFIMDKFINVGNILEAILGANIPNLIAANVFDVYHGDKLADTKLKGKAVKSVAINLLFQAYKTLNDDEINQSIAKIQLLIETNFIAQLRI